MSILPGQNSYGDANPNDPANWQKTISTYCQDDVINAIPIAFVDVFFSTGGLPELDLANASGMTGEATFSSDAQGTAFANTIWDLFLGGSSSTRPFGSAVLDGVDLDIEVGAPTGFAAFANQIRSLSAGASKPYYITAAPQCPYPDAHIGGALNAASFDAVYVQVMLSSEVSNEGNPADWDYSSWDTWANTVSLNPSVKVFIGAPASSTAAGSGYVDATTLGSIALSTRASFSSFGGIMLWDASQAFGTSSFVDALV
ncbi:glycoside hydrolase superfamily [Mycena haematopus]|nr:glycoside hydrolase superfamily [Mycena haematopus]